jgi:hypothetical protein
MKRLFIAAVSVAAMLSACGGSGDSTKVAAVAASASDAKPIAKNSYTPGSIIPDADISAMAQATLPVGTDQATLNARAQSIAQFIASNGGDVIYTNYLNEYGAPTDVRQNYYIATSDLSSQKLGYYYLSHPLSSAADTIWFDCTDVSAQQMQASPTLQALCALSQWDAYTLTGDATYARATVSQADSFIANGVNGKIEWTSTTVPSHGITTTPWISGLTQSVATSVLLRAYQYTNDQKYLAAAQQTYYWLTVPVARGGVQSSDIGTWLEEYPTQVQGGTSSHVFNGDVWALFGVWDYYRVTKDQNALALFNANISAIKANLSWYDRGYWNVYSHLDQVSMVDGLYMQFITQQMYALYYITGDASWQALGNKWHTDQYNDALFVHNIATSYLQQCGC